MNKKQMDQCWMICVHLTFHGKRYKIGVPQATTMHGVSRVNIRPVVVSGKWQVFD